MDNSIALEVFLYFYFNCKNPIRNFSLYETKSIKKWR